MTDEAEADLKTARNQRDMLGRRVRDLEALHSATVVERDEARAEVKARVEAAEAAVAAITEERNSLDRILSLVERKADAAAGLRARAEAAEAALKGADRLLAFTLARADAAEAQLAALMEAARVVLLYGSDDGLTDRNYQPIAPGTGPFAKLREVLEDTRAAAEAYRAGVRREVLREAADRVGESFRHAGGDGWAMIPSDDEATVAAWLCAMGEEGVDRD